MTLRNTHIRALLLMAVVLLVACSAHSRVVRSYRSAPASADNAIAFTVDSIDFRPDLTRVYGRLTGKPHTSHRIDDATLVTKTAVVEATDIDGIDFRRYFQWEDEGEIAIEIDFPRVKDPKAVEFTTVRGKATINIAPAK